MKKEKAKRKFDPEERVEAIKAGLKEGKTRKEIAAELGYTNWRGMDTFMRRRDYRWDGEFYIPKDWVPGRGRDILPSRVRQVVENLEGENPDPMEAAKKAGFRDMQEMADYMGEMGYVWSADLKRYIPKEESEGKEVVPKETRKEDTEEETTPGPVEAEGNGLGELEKYIPLLEFLASNQSELEEILKNGHAKQNGQIARYTVPGAGKSKTIYMSERTVDLLERFCDSRGMSQRELVETALIQFLLDNGYESEVEKALRP